MISDTKCNFFGVLSANTTNFNMAAADGMTVCYEIGDGLEFYTKWREITFPVNAKFTPKTVADCKGKECKLRFYYNGKNSNEQDKNHVIIWPELNQEWCPFVIQYNHKPYSIIQHVGISPCSAIVVWGNKLKFCKLHHGTV